MTDNIISPRIEDDVIYLDLGATIGDSLLRQIADSVRDLRPIVEDCRNQNGYAPTMAALVAIVANEAIERGDAEAFADIFRQNAEMLEADGRVNVPAIDAATGHSREYRTCL